MNYIKRSLLKFYKQKIKKISKNDIINLFWFLLMILLIKTIVGNINIERVKKITNNPVLTEKNNIGNSLGNKIEINELKNIGNSDSLNQALISSKLHEDIYNNKQPEVEEVVLARGEKIGVPNGYELALGEKYSHYKVLVFRQKNKKIAEDVTEIDKIMPQKPLLVAIVGEDNKIINLFVLNAYSVLRGSIGYGDYEKEKIKNAVEIRDINNDGIDEIIIYTFKGYTADIHNGMITIYFDVKQKMFAIMDKIFVTTLKDAYRIIKINKKVYVLEANSGSGNCRVCPTPYIIRIYRDYHNYYFDIGSVGVGKEYDKGVDAIKYALSRIKKKIIANDVYILDQ